MAEKITKLRHLQTALTAAKTQIADVAGAAAEAIEELSRTKADAGHTHTAAQVGAVTQAYVDSLLGDIASALDKINGEVV